MHEFQPLTQAEVVAALSSWNAGRRAGFPKGETVEPVWPNGAAPVIVGSADGLECRTLLWGFPPPTGNKPVFNARSEKLFDSGHAHGAAWCQHVGFGSRPHKVTCCSMSLGCPCS